MTPKYIDVTELIPDDTIVFSVKDPDATSPKIKKNNLILVKIINVEEYECKDVSGILCSGNYTANSEEGDVLFPNGFWFPTPRKVLLINREGV